MGTNVTDAALRFLEAIRETLAVQQYFEILRAVEAIRKERGATWIGQVHCELALERMARENSHAA